MIANREEIQPCENLKKMVDIAIQDRKTTPKEIFEAYTISISKLNFNVTIKLTEV